MVLLFLAVWAIVIALNEVLFSAQPFTLTSVADAMPSTLMLSVFLSAAVYLAKKKIIDALHKGRSIDKRFVAELTPQVGHELNNVRRQMEGEVKDKDNTYKPNKVRRSTTTTRRKINPYTAAVEAARTPHNRARREAYQRSYGERTRHNLDAPELKKAQEGLEALDALGALNTDSGADVPMMTHTKSMSKTDKLRESKAKALRASKESSSSNSSFTSSTASSAAPSSSSTASAAARSANAMGKRSLGPSMAERKAQIEQSKEQQKQRRREQIEALSTLSQEDKAKAQSLQKNAEAQKKQRQKERQEQEAKAKAQAHQEFNQLKESLNPFAKKDAVRSKLGEKTKNNAQEQGSESKDATIAQSKSKSGDDKTILNTRTAKGEAYREEQNTGTISAPMNARERAQMQRNLEQLQQEARDTLGNNAFSASGNDNQVPDFVDKLEIPSKGNSQLDVSSLQRSPRPKQGAGLDTSALKKVTLSPAASANMQHAAAPFKPQQVSGLSSNEQGAGSRAGVGGRMLKTTRLDHLGAGNSMLKRSGELGVSTPKQGGSGMSAYDNAAAMSTALNNDATMERGPVKSQSLSEFQANARARALARAQSPKAGHSWAGAKKVKKPNLRGTASADATRAESTQRVGSASTLGLNNARSGLPTQIIPSDEAPVRKVVTTSMKLQVGPHSDNLPKVRPSDVIADLQLSPKIKARASGNIKRNREKLLKPGPNFINAAATAAAKGTVGSTSHQMTKPQGHSGQGENIHAQNQADTYHKMQQQPPKDTPTDEQA